MTVGSYFSCWESGGPEWLFTLALAGGLGAILAGILAANDTATPPERAHSGWGLVAAVVAIASTGYSLLTTVRRAGLASGISC